MILSFSDSAIPRCSIEKSGPLPDHIDLQNILIYNEINNTFSHESEERKKWHRQNKEKHLQKSV